MIAGLSFSETWDMCAEFRGLGILNLMDISSSRQFRALLRPQSATVAQPAETHQQDEPKCTGCLGTSLHSCRNSTVNINAATT